MNTQEKSRTTIISRVAFTFFIPVLLIFLYSNSVIPIEYVQVFFISYSLIAVIIPITFKFNYNFQRNVVFLNNVNLPKFANFNHPERHGLNGARNFYIKTSDNVHLGVWHILPEKLVKENLSKEEEEEYFEKTLSYNLPVFIYMHGNSSNRAAGHHIELHKVLRKNFHVVTFDYRGYGDSGGLPMTEKIVINDSMTILRWIKQLTTAPILVWGHSLGTAIAVHTLRRLTEENDCFIKGLVLESPFDNMRNEVSEHPMTLIFRYLPWFEKLVVDSIYNSGFLFASDDHINHVKCPITILHAEDDWIVPFKLGFELYSTASSKRNSDQGPIQFKKFSKKFGYGHKYICRAPELPHIVIDFVEECISKKF